MTEEMKLLRAFIEASGFDIEEVKTFNEAQYLVEEKDMRDNPEDYRGAFCKSPPFKPAFTEIDYKLTKKPDELTVLDIGDLFCFGCESVRKDLIITLEKLGVTSSKEKDLRNVCKEIIDTVAFHIKKDL